MGKQVKTIIWVLVLGFLLFYLVTNPEGAANAVRTVGRQLVDLHLLREPGPLG